MIPDVPYRFTIRPLPEDEGGGSLIEFPDLPGYMSDGIRSRKRSRNGVDAMHGWIAAMRAEGHPITAPCARRRHQPLADMVLSGPGSPRGQGRTAQR